MSPLLSIYFPVQKLQRDYVYPNREGQQFCSKKISYYGILNISQCKYKFLYIYIVNVNNKINEGRYLSNFKLDFFYKETANKQVILRDILCTTTKLGSVCHLTTETKFTLPKRIAPSNKKDTIQLFISIFLSVRPYSSLFKYSLNHVCDIY